MDIVTDNFLDNLLPPDPDSNHGTGALPRPVDPRDWHLELIPEVAEQLTAGLPASFMVLPIDQIHHVEDQGQTPACVAFSTCGVKSIEDFQDVGWWNRYDAMELYKAAGGDGSNGVYTDTVLRYVRDTGCLEVGTGKRWKIQSYFFAPQVPVAWRETIAAALVSSGPCVVAALLPARFGWDSDEQATAAYHQMAILGYSGLGDDDHVILLNSWGPGWGNKGCGRLKWRYLEGNNFQGRYAYAYKLLDMDDPSPIPDPDPPIPPDPDAPPVITKLKYKNNKVVVNGVFTAGAVLFMDGTKKAVTAKNNQFKFSAPGLTGQHTVKVEHLDGQSVSRVFTVK